MSTKQSRNEYYVYVLRCCDGSYYTGITNCLQRRMQQHFGLLDGGAKYTRAHQPVCLEQVFCTQNRSCAQKWEYRIRKLTHQQKEILIQTPTLLAEFFADLSNDEICVLPREEWANKDRF